METARNPWSIAGPLTAVCVTVLLGGALFIVSGLKPVKVTAPKSFASFKANDKSFQCSYPSDWERKAHEAMGTVSEARFEKGGARIEVSADLTGSLLADASQSPGATPDLSGMPGLSGLPQAGEKQVPPVEKLHKMYREEYSGRFKEFEEQPAKPFRSQMGDARWSEFTADAGFPVGKIHGYRATLLGGERAVTVLCRCPEGDWAALKPAFGRVIGSVSPAAQ